MEVAVLASHKAINSGDHIHAIAENGDQSKSPDLSYSNTM
jgi:hypothetical protein